MFFGNKTPAQDNAPAAQEPAAADVVFEAGTADFEARVLRASMEKPVVAYFTAPWCGPCKQLGPQLESAVRAAGGVISLARINLDENQELAQALRIQSVPTVFAFFQGQPVDAFQGNVPESQLKAFIDKVVQAARQAAPDALDIPEALKGAAQAMADGDLGAAQAIYAQILQQDEKNAQAFTGLVRLFIAAGQMEQARELVARAPEEVRKNSVFKEAETALELAEAQPAGSPDELAKAVERNPDDHQARLDLAQAQFSAGQREAAMETLLTSIERDREWQDQAARKQLLKFFEAMGHADPLTIESRKKLSSLLFS